MLQKHWCGSIGHKSAATALVSYPTSVAVMYVAAQRQSLVGLLARVAALAASGPTC